jgi:hypothetical protein
LTSHPAWLGALILAALLGGLALAGRLYNLDRYSGSYPEGIRAEQLMLMAAGFRPFQDIFSDQGPWLLQALYPGFWLFGGTLVGVRAVVVAASLVGLCAAAWIGCLLAGRAGGLAVFALLMLSPIYLEFSRLALAEVLAVGPALLAVGCGLRYAAAPGRGWLLAAAALLALSLLIKPIAFGAGLAVGLAVWQGGGRRWRRLGLLAAATGLLTLAGMLLAGLPEILQQIVAFRVASREAEGWRLADNLARAQLELAPEGLALFGLALLGGGLALRQPKAWPLLVWCAASGLTLAIHAPLRTKHFVIVVVPLALLAGYGVGRLAQLAARSPRRPTALAARAGLLAGAVLLALSLPGLLARQQWLLTSDDLFERDEARGWYGQAAGTLERVARPGEMVLTDHPYLAFRADRLVPPGLVEASAVRVRAGSLTDAQAIATLEQFGVRAVLLWADKLLELRGFNAWLTEAYAPVQLWAAEGPTRPILWLRRDARLADDRVRLRTGVTALPEPAAYGDWRLLGGGLQPAETVAAGSLLSVVLELESAAAAPADGRVVLTLRDASGRTAEEEREPLLASALRPAWFFWVGGLTLPADLPAGRYQVTAALRTFGNTVLGPPVAVGTVEVVPSGSL